MRHHMIRAKFPAGAPCTLMGVSELRQPTPIIQIWAGRGLCCHARVRVQNGGSFARRTKTQVALRNMLPRQPASSAGRVHGCRPSTQARLRSRAVPVALDPVCGVSGWISVSFDGLAGEPVGAADVRRSNCRTCATSLAAPLLRFCCLHGSFLAIGEDCRSAVTRLSC